MLVSRQLLVPRSYDAGVSAIRVLGSGYPSNGTLGCLNADPSAAWRKLISGTAAQQERHLCKGCFTASSVHPFGQMAHAGGGCRAESYTSGMLRFAALFILVPIIELSLLVSLGRVVGVGATIGLVIATGILGAWLARSQGLRVWREWNEAVQLGKMPEEDIVAALLVLVGGVLLLTPGIVTDALGLLLLIPKTRGMIARTVQLRTRTHVQPSVSVFTRGIHVVHAPSRPEPIDVKVVSVRKPSCHELSGRSSS